MNIPERGQGFSTLAVLQDNCFPNKQFNYYTFDNYQGSDQTSTEKLKKYATQFNIIKKDNIGLLLCGEVGRGKTYLACSIANYVMENFKDNVRFFSMTSLLKDIAEEEYKKEHYLLKLIESESLLIFDDFVDIKNSDYKKELLYQVINTRYMAKKPIIVTTNLTIQELKGENYDRMMQRIIDRLLEMCVPVYIQGSNYRKKIANDKKQKLMALFSEKE